MWRLVCLLCVCAQVVFGAPLVQPLVISSTASTWSATLTVETARVNAGQVSFVTRLYCYNGQCSYPAPTIQLKPGDNFQLTLTNNLQGVENYNMTLVMNTFHGPNTTNIHTHGLHVSQNVDSIFYTVKPGQSHIYNYSIPATHAPGLHWYHSHFHGSSTLLVMGGLHGAIVVAPAAGINMPTSITTMTSYVMVLSHLKFNQALSAGQISQGCGFGWPCQSFQGCTAWPPGTCQDVGASCVVAPFSPFRAYSMPELSAACDSNVTIGQSFADSSVQDLYLVNGQWMPTVSALPQQRQIFRFVNAAGEYELTLRAPAGCTMYVIAADGVYYKAPGASVTRVMFAPATRYEMVLYCANAGTYNFTGEWGDAQTQLRQTLFTLVVSGAVTANADVSTSDMSGIIRPYYLQDMTTLPGTSINSTYALEFSQGGDRNSLGCKFWLGGGNNCTKIWTGQAQPSTTDANCPFATFQGQQGGDGSNGPGAAPATARYKLVTQVGAANEWRVYGLGLDGHPFHMHVNHFQIVGFTPTPGAARSVFSDYTFVGEWRDTIPAFDGELLIRFWSADFAGETVIHCHFLRHEDLGMMDTFYICDGTPGSCPNATLPQLNWYSNGGTGGGGGGGAASSVTVSVMTWLCTVVAAAMLVF